MSRIVGVDDFIKLVETFVDRKWTEYPDYSTVLSRYADLFSLLDDEEKELILELTQRYLWLGFSEYGKMGHELKKLLAAELVGKL